MLARSLIGGGAALVLTLFASPAPAAPLHREARIVETAQREFQLETGVALPGSVEAFRDGVPLQEGVDFTLDSSHRRILLTRPLPEGSVLSLCYLPLALEHRAPGKAKEGNAAPSLRRHLSRELLAGAEQARLTGPLPATPPRGTVALREQLLSGLRRTDIAQRSEESRGSNHLSYSRLDPLDPRTATEGREEFRNRLSLRTGEEGRLAWETMLARESLFSEYAAELEKQRLQYERTWGRSSTSLMWERQRADGYGVANALDALSVSLAHPFSRSTSAEGFFSHERSAFRGEETEGLVSLRQRLLPGVQAQGVLQLLASEFSGGSLTGGLTLLAQPAPFADVKLALRQSDSERWGEFRRLGADVALHPNPRLQLRGEYSSRDSESLGDVRNFGLGLSAQPWNRTLLEAAFSRADGGTLGRESAGTLRLLADPSSSLRLQFGFDEAFSEENGRSRTGLWMVTAGGSRYVRLEGYSAQRRPEDDAAFLDALYRLEVRPVLPLSLSGQVRRVELPDDPRAVGGLGATLALSRWLELGGGYRRALGEAAADEAPGRDLRLSLLPLPGLRLFGQYRHRPDDEQGALLDERHRSLGLEATFGPLSLQGGVTRTEGLTTLEPGSRSDLLATLNFGRTRLFGGLTVEDRRVEETLRAHLYRFGISRAAGSRLFILVEGQFGWLAGPGGARVWSVDDARAQARLGLRF